MKIKKFIKTLIALDKTDVYWQDCWDWVFFIFGESEAIAKFTTFFMKGDDGMIKNKIYALLMLSLGLVSTALTKDATVMVLMAVIAVPMFFSKKEWIY